MSHFLSCLFTATISGLPSSIIIIIIIISFITVFAGVLFVHQPGANHAPRASVTQVRTLSTFLRSYIIIIIIINIIIIIVIIIIIIIYQYMYVMFVCVWVCAMYIIMISFLFLYFSKVFISVSM